MILKSLSQVSLIFHSPDFPVFFSSLPKNTNTFSEDLAARTKSEPNVFRLPLESHTVLEMASSSALTKPKSEMTPEELEAKEQQEFNTGPLSVLTESVKGNTQVNI